MRGAAGRQIAPVLVGKKLEPLELDQSHLADIGELRALAGFERIPVALDAHHLQ